MGDTLSGIAHSRWRNLITFVCIKYLLVGDTIRGLLPRFASPLSPCTALFNSSFFYQTMASTVGKVSTLAEGWSLKRQEIWNFAS